MKAHFQVKVSFTRKEHILTCHLEEWLDENQQRLAKFSEQAGEAGGTSRCPLATQGEIFIFSKN